jgi:uncharacterized protein
MDLLARIKRFLGQYDVRIYSEHLSYSKCDNAHLYDLLPIPFRSDAVKHVADRIRIAQDFLERRIAIENVSYYMPVAPEMDEATFLSAILEEADCDLLLDVNNVYVNAFNHKYDALDFLGHIPLNRVNYVHMAGHEQKNAELIIDTHGRPIIDPVYELLRETCRRISPVPVLLERDYNHERPEEIFAELERLQSILDGQWRNRVAA